MLYRPQRAYQQLATILRLPGTQSIEGLQSEAVPTQDLQRVLQDQRVNRYVMVLSDTPAASGNVDGQWNDISDWTEVRRNGILIADDAAMPQRNEHRIITTCSMRIQGTAAEYTTAEFLRRTATTIAMSTTVASFGVQVAANSMAPQTPPTLLPQVLQFEENTWRWTQVVSGANADLTMIVEMLTAERGVMHPYFGI